MEQFIELLAVITGSIYGVLLARQHKMDFVGVFSLALIVSFGGGTLRDLFLDRHPLFWIRESHYTIVVFLVSIAVFFVPQFPKKTEDYLSVPDALALGLFSVAGTSAALDLQTPLFIAAMLGVITGTFGGVMGDVICNRIPRLFRPSTPLYATCSFVGSWIYIGLTLVPALSGFAAPLAIIFIVVFRLYSFWKKWSLPFIADDDVGE
jgi:uncharacterized membrane protein YeiH